MRARSLTPVILAGLAICASVGVVVGGSPFKESQDVRFIQDGQDDGVALPEPILPQGPKIDLPSVTGAADHDVPVNQVVIPAPRVSTNAPEAVALDLYLTSQRGRLLQLLATAPAQQVIAAITFRRPMTEDEVTEILAKEDADPVYFEWTLMDGPEHGGAAWELRSSVAQQYPGTLVTYVTTRASVGELTRMAAEPAVWLVDIGSATSGRAANVLGLPRNYYFDAQKAGMLDE